MKNNPQATISLEMLNNNHEKVKIFIVISYRLISGNFGIPYITSVTKMS